MKLIFVTIMLAVNRYGQASVPFIIPSVTISSEQCASQSTAATILESLEKNFSGIIENNIPTFPSDALVNAVAMTVLGFVWLT